MTSSGAQDRLSDQSDSRSDARQPAAAGLSGTPPPEARASTLVPVSLIFLLSVCGYFALQVVFRVLSAANLGLDEAEQLVMGQSLQAGYGPQPPLYTWLFLALQPITGESVLTLALLKFGLLAVTLCATFRLCRQLFGDPLAAAVAALSLLYLPQVSWESQRALTHSVIALATVALASTVFVDLVTRRRTRDYWLFGAALAACALSKHNAVFLPLGLLLAGLLLPAARPALLDRRAVWALGLSFLLVAPNLIWMALNGEAVLARSAKLGFDPSTGALDSLSAVGRALLSFALLPAVLVGLIALVPDREGKPAWQVSAEVRRLLTLALGLAASLVLLIVLVASVGNMKDRWLTPFLFLAVPVALAWIAPRLTRRRLRVAAAVAVAIAIGSMAALWLRQFLPADWAAPPNMEAPFDLLATELPEHGLLLSTSNWVAGNLRLHRPGLSAATPEYKAVLRQPPPAPVLLIWRARDGDAVPPALEALAEEALGRSLPVDLPVRTLAAPYPGGGPTLALHLVQVPVSP